MRPSGRYKWLHSLGAGLLGLGIAWPCAAQPPAVVMPNGKPLEIRVTAAQPPAPSVSLTLANRQGHATPQRAGLVHTGGGNTDVAQPAPDTVVITMAGVAVAVGGPCRAGSASIDFRLAQDFEIVFEKSDVKAARLTVEVRAIGLLRSHPGGGMAEFAHGQVTVGSLAGNVLSLAMPDHCVAGGESLSINDHVGPTSIVVGAGKYTLCQTVHIQASHPRSILPCKAASAEFAPDPALDPLWISYWEPFHGAAKKDFGFQVIIKVAPEEVVPEAEKKAPAMVPAGLGSPVRPVRFEAPTPIGLSQRVPALPAQRP